MVRDHLGVAARGVAQALDGSAPARQRAPAAAAGAASGCRSPSGAQQRERLGGRRPRNRRLLWSEHQRVVGVAGVDAVHSQVAGDVGAGHAEVAGRGEQVGEPALVVSSSPIGASRGAEPLPSYAVNRTGMPSRISESTASAIARSASEGLRVTPSHRLVVETGQTVVGVEALLHRGQVGAVVERVEVARVVERLGVQALVAPELVDLLLDGAVERASGASGPT